MDKRSTGAARYSDESGIHGGLYLSPGWWSLVKVAGPVGLAGIGLVMWLAGRPARDEVDKKVDAVRIEVKQDMQNMRNEIRQDIQDLRQEMRRLLRKEK